MNNFESHIGGNEDNERQKASLAAYNRALERRIASVAITGERGTAIRIDFDDNTSLLLEDADQQCCERRYITTDDNLDDIVGQTLLAIKRRHWETLYNSDETCHQTQFLEVQTDKDFVTFAAHNEHNGYYSGFCLECTFTQTD